MAAASRSTLLAFCRSLPHVTEDVKWGNDLVFSIGDKMFAGFANDGKDATFGCKVPEEDFAALTSVDGIRPAAYAARFHWISVEDPKVMPESAAKALLQGSYDIVRAKLPKGVQRRLDGGGAAPARALSRKRPKPKAAPKKAAPKKAAPKKAAPKKAAPKKAAPKKKRSAR